MLTLTAPQSSQPQFGDVLVGVVGVGFPSDVPTARLFVRDPRTGAATWDVPVGESLSFEGRGTLTVWDIQTEVTGSGRPEVTFQFEEDMPWES